MKLESITVENYRQFEKAELAFDEGITILAGANNSGKTSLINLIKNIFVDDKLNYNMSDIPAKNMREWVEWVYPIFQKFFRDGKTEENVEKDLLNVVIPKEETDPTHLMKMTTVKIHVSYNPDIDDIKLFADCIMDLDETKHDFYFMYNFEIVHTRFAREIINNFSKIKHRFAEIDEKKSQYAETADELIINNIQVKERYLKQLIVSLYIQATIPNVYFCDEDYKNKCKFDETKKFRQLFNFCFIKASRPLDDDESDHSHMLSKQMIKMVKMDEQWNELVESLPDEVLKPIQEKEIDKAIRSTSLESLKDTIAALEQTNGGKSGELMLDMQIKERLEKEGELLEMKKPEEEFIDAMRYLFGEEFVKNEKFTEKYKKVLKRDDELKGHYGDCDSVKQLMLYIRKNMRKYGYAPNYKLPEIFENNELDYNKYREAVIEGMRNSKFEKLFPETYTYEFKRNKLEYDTDGWNYNKMDYQEEDWICKKRGSYHCYYNQLDHYLSHLLSVIRKNSEMGNCQGIEPVRMELKQKIDSYCMAKKER